MYPEGNNICAVVPPGPRHQEKCSSDDAQEEEIVAKEKGCGDYFEPELAGRAAWTKLLIAK